MKSFSRVQLFVTPWTVAHQVRLSIGLPRQEYWSAISFSRGFSRPRDWTRVSGIEGRRFTVWATRESQEYWSGLLFPPPGNLPDPGIKPRSAVSPASPGGLLTTSTTSTLQFSSVAQACPTLCDPMDCSTTGLPVHHQLVDLAQTHVHQVGDAIQPSHPLSSPSPPAPNPSQHQGLFKRVSSSHKVAKVLELQLQHQSFQWIFRTDFL